MLGVAPVRPSEIAVDGEHCAGGVPPGSSSIDLTANGDGTVTLQLIEEGTDRVLQTLTLPWDEL